MLENVIGRSPKAWGLGPNAKICFPPARGAYFSIKCFQTPGLEVLSRRGRPPGREGPASRFLVFFGFFLNFNFISIFIGLKPHFGRFLASILRFWPPQTHPKSTPNAKKSRFSKVQPKLQMPHGNHIRTNSGYAKA